MIKTFSFPLNQDSVFYLEDVFTAFIESLEEKEVSNLIEEIHSCISQDLDKNNYPCEIHFNKSEFKVDTNKLKSFCSTYIRYCLDTTIRPVSADIFVLITLQILIDL